jgi:hypothetical protein
MSLVWDNRAIPSGPEQNINAKSYALSNALTDYFFGETAWQRPYRSNQLYKEKLDLVSIANNCLALGGGRVRCSSGRSAQKLTLTSY